MATIEIPLNNGLVALIDEDDDPLVRQYHWWAKESDNERLYAITEPMVNYQKSVIRMHRLILGFPNTPDIDHWNGNGLDNRRSNLRAATHSQNMMNRPAPITNTSGYKGVSWHRKAGKWMAMIWDRNKQIYLGLYVDPVEAALAYDAAAIRLHGEFAYLNFGARLGERNYASPG